MIDAVLAEYASIRSEIQQLNGQVFAVLSSSLAANIAVLGWFFGKDNPHEFFPLPTVGILLLLGGTIILLNRNRLAHRLALFQKYFIESRIPDICWGRVYFEYRNRYPRSNLVPRLAERLAESGADVLLATSVINVCVIIFVGLRPFSEAGSTVIDWWQVANFVIALVLLSLQLCFGRVMTDYRAIDVTMRRIANKCGLTR